MGQKISYANWHKALAAALDALDTSDILSDDESVGAEEAFNEGVSPKIHAAQIDELRSWAADKFSGDLWK